jgi:hypothetical protein
VTRDHSKTVKKTKTETVQIRGNCQIPNGAACAHPKTIKAKKLKRSGP